MQANASKCKQLKQMQANASKDKQINQINLLSTMCKHKSIINTTKFKQQQDRVTRDARVNKPSVEGLLTRACPPTFMLNTSKNKQIQANASKCKPMQANTSKCKQMQENASKFRQI